MVDEFESPADERLQRALPREETRGSEQRQR